MPAAKPKPKSKRKPPTPPADKYAAHRERMGAAQREQATAGKEIGPLPAVVDPARKARGRESLESFALEYFPGRCPWPFGQSHRAGLARTQRCTDHGGLNATAWPRGGGKTTLAEIAVIRAMVYGLRKFGALVQATEKHAGRSLKKIIREFETNDFLLADFPEVCHPIRKLERINQRSRGQTLDGEQTRMEWTADGIVLPTVKGAASSGGILCVVGITGAIRGLSAAGPDGSVIRPDLIVVDDAQTRDSARSPSQTAERETIITDDILGLAGPGVELAVLMLCTVMYAGDLSDRFLDPERHPEWQGMRTRMLESFPAKMELWDQYAEIRRESFRSGNEGVRGTEFYAENRESMDAGAAVSWPERMKPGELSGIQSAMNIYIDNPRGFKAEYQNEAEPVGGSSTGKEIAPVVVTSALSGLARFEVPREASRLVAFIDAGGGKGRGLWYGVAAFDNHFGAALLDYGTWPRQARSLFAADDMRPGLAEAYPKLGETERLYAGLGALADDVLGRTYLRETTGEQLRVERCLIDCGWQSSTVYKFIRESKHAGVLLPSKGIGRTTTSRGVSEWKPRPGERSGFHWRLTISETGRGRMVQFDPDAWKSFLHERVNTSPGGRGRLVLFAREPAGRAADHEMLGEHLHAEYADPITLRGATFDKWQERPHKPDNHLLDVIVGLMLAASVQGLTWSPSGAPAEPKAQSAPRAKVKLSDLYAAKHG